MTPQNSMYTWFHVWIRVITKLPNNLTKGKSKLICTDKISEQQENCENRNDPDLVQAFLKKWWIEIDFKAPKLPFSLRLNWERVNTFVHCLYMSIYSVTPLWLRTNQSLILMFRKVSGCEKRFAVRCLASWSYKQVLSFIL